VCFGGISLSAGGLVRYVSLRYLIQVDSGARSSSTSIYSDCSLSYVIKFPLNLEIPKFVVSFKVSNNTFCVRRVYGWRYR
jgi:hypothetical protein